MINIYNPYSISYGRTILQKIAFADFTRKETQLDPVSNSYKTTLFKDNLALLGYEKMVFSLSTDEEMNFIPLKDNCVIPLSASEKMEMTAVEIDLYEQNEALRCIDDFLYAQNRTFQLVSFLNVAYSHLSKFFGSDYTYVVPYGSSYINISNGEIGFFSDVSNVFRLDIYHSRFLDEFNGAITDNYLLDISMFLTTIDFFSMSNDNFYKLLVKIGDEFNRYPKDIRINPDTGLSYDMVSNLDTFSFYSQTHFLRTFKFEAMVSLRSPLIKIGVDSRGKTIWGYGERVKTVTYEDVNLNIIADGEKTFFYSDDGNTFFTIEIITFDSKKTVYDYDVYPNGDSVTFYRLGADTVYFKLVFFSLPDYLRNNLGNDSRSDLIAYLGDLKDKQKKTCCLVKNKKNTIGAQNG